MRRLPSAVLKVSSFMPAMAGSAASAALSSSCSFPSHSATEGCDLVEDGAEFLRAQQRHGGHRDQAGLHRAQPGQRHGHRVAAAQQHAVAGHQAQVHGEHVGDAVHLDGCACA
jgi:hypothetical protein